MVAAAEPPYARDTRGGQEGLWHDADEYCSRTQRYRLSDHPHPPFATQETTP
jgi:hypothetical protein